MIAIIDYGMANLRSVERALAYAGGSPIITSNSAVIAQAERVVLPGVGAFCACMSNLNSRGLNEAVLLAIEKGKPFLGICVGLQMLFESSTEMGENPGLGLLPGRVVKFFEPESGTSGQPSAIQNPKFETRKLKVPHIGWNALEFPRPTSLFRGVEEGSRVYFVHSYYPAPTDPAITAAYSDYGGQFCCAVERGCIAATQFHPEKSGAIGQRILRNFLAWKP